MGEESSLAACEHRRHPPALDCDVGPTDGIDPLMDVVEPPVRDPVTNAPRTEPNRNQLDQANYAVLCRRDGDD
jgi:hypothetical protein